MISKDPYEKVFALIGCNYWWAPIKIEIRQLMPGYRSLWQSDPQIAPPYWMDEDIIKRSYTIIVLVHTTLHYEYGQKCLFFDSCHGSGEYEHLLSNPGKLFQFWRSCPALAFSKVYRSLFRERSRYLPLRIDQTENCAKWPKSLSKLPYRLNRQQATGACSIWISGIAFLSMSAINLRTAIVFEGQHARYQHRQCRGVLSSSTVRGSFTV